MAALVTTADDLDTPMLQPVKEHLQDRQGHGTSDPSSQWSTQSGHSRVKKLWYIWDDTPRSHFFYQMVCWREDLGVSLVKQFDRSRGFAGASAAVELAQLVPPQWVVVAGRDAG